MAVDHRALIREHSQPLVPIPTQRTAELHPLPGVRAILWDVYGTLLVSGSGDVGTARQSAQRSAMVGALAAVGLCDASLTDEVIERYFAAIEASHRRSRRVGIAHPEVNIPAIWEVVLEGLVHQHKLAPEQVTRIDSAHLALEYELRSNPCWPMPEAGETLAAVHWRGLVQGLVSNAQFYTPQILETLLGGPLDLWGIAPGMRFYSYHVGWAKPELVLFEMAAEALARKRIRPAEVVFVGNDMGNDIAPAAAVGFRTVLFAGDARSLRSPADDSPGTAPSPNAVLTELAQLPELLV